jgi:hypothetical protein
MRTESAFLSASDSFAQILVQQLVVAEHRSALPSANCLALKKYPCLDRDGECHVRLAPCCEAFTIQHPWNQGATASLGFSVG